MYVPELGKLHAINDSVLISWLNCLVVLVGLASNIMIDCMYSNRHKKNTDKHDRDDRSLRSMCLEISDLLQVQKL